MSEDPQLVNALIREELLLKRVTRVSELLHDWDRRSTRGEWFPVDQAARELSRALSEWEEPDG